MHANKTSALSGLIRLVFILGAMLAVGLARAGSAGEIEANADAALSEFRRTVKGAEEYLAAAQGVLVIPEVKKVGLVVGGQWGKGVLRIRGKTVDYYRLAAASVGFQAGVQQANYLFIFLTEEALKSFRSGPGWDAGIDAGVTLIDESIGTSVDTLKAKSSVVAFIFGKEGLMAGYSLKGQKLTQFKPE